MTNTLQLFLLNKRIYAKDLIEEILVMTPKNLKFNLMEAIYARYIDLYKKIIIRYHAMHNSASKISIVSCDNCFPLMSTLYGETNYSIKWVDEIIQSKIKELKNNSIKKYNCSSINNSYLLEEINKERIKQFLLDILFIHKQEYNEMKQRLIILEKLTHINNDFIAKFNDFNIEWSKKFDVIKTVLCTLLRVEVITLCTKDEIININDLVYKKEKNFMQWLHDIKEDREILNIIRFSIQLLDKEEIEGLNLLMKKNIMICTNCLRDVIYNYESLYISYDDFEETIKLNGQINEESMETIKIQATPFLTLIKNEKEINNKIQLKKYELISLIYSYFNYLNNKFQLIKIYEEAKYILNKIDFQIRDLLELYLKINPIYLDSLLINLIKIKGTKDITLYYNSQYENEYIKDKSYIYHLLIKYNEIDICRFNMSLIKEYKNINSGFYFDYINKYNIKNLLYERLFNNKQQKLNPLYSPLSLTNKLSSLLLDLDDERLYLFKNDICQEILERYLYHKMIKEFYLNSKPIELKKNMKYWIFNNKDKLESVCYNINNSIFIPCLDYNKSIETSSYNKESYYTKPDQISIQSVNQLIDNEAHIKYNDTFNISFSKFRLLFSVSEYSFLKISLLGYNILLSLLQYKLLKQLVDEYIEDETNKNISKNSIEYNKNLFGLKDILISVIKNKAYLIMNPVKRDKQYIDIRYIANDIIWHGIYKFINKLKRMKKLEIINFDEDLIKECVSKGIGRVEGRFIIYIP